MSIPKMKGLNLRFPGFNMWGKSAQKASPQLTNGFYKSVPVAYQMRYSLLRKIRNDEELFPHIHGRIETKKDVVRALLSGAHPYLVSEEGTGKTRLARSVASLLPPIFKIKGCPYNDDPTWASQLLCPRCREAKDPVRKFGIEVVPPGERFSRIQGNEYTNEAKLLGLKDIHAIVQGKNITDQSVFTGTGAFRANRGILFIDELPAIRTNVQVLLHPLLEEKKVILEEYNWHYPLDLILIATGNPRGYSHVYDIPRPLLDRMELIYMDMPEEDVEKEIILRERFRTNDDQHEYIKYKEENFVPYPELEKEIRRTVAAPWWIMDIINRTVRYSRICPNLEKKASIRAGNKALDHTYATVEMEKREVANLKDACYGLKLALRGRIGLNPEYLDLDEPKKVFIRTEKLVEDLIWNAIEDFSLSIFEGCDREKLASEMQTIASFKLEETVRSFRKYEHLAGLIDRIKRIGIDNLNDALLDGTERQLVYDPESAGEQIQQEYYFSLLELVINASLHRGIISEYPAGGVFIPQKLDKMNSW